MIYFYPTFRRCAISCTLSHLFVLLEERNKSSNGAMKVSTHRMSWKECGGARAARLGV